MNKLDMAHDYMVAWMRSGNSEIIDANELASFFFSVADAMQAEADKREPKGFPEVLQGDWQPDWSVAPVWANWWAYSGDNTALWFQKEPEIYKNNIWFVEQDGCFVKYIFKKAPSFNYQGDWKQSLRKRPQ